MMQVAMKQELCCMQKITKKNINEGEFAGVCKNSVDKILIIYQMYVKDTGQFWLEKHFMSLMEP